MAGARQQEEFASYVQDMLQLIGPVTCKRMFGGHGFFLDGLMFALMADNTLYLKADDHNMADFTGQGLESFSYQKNGKTMKISYYQAPAEALEDAEVLSNWANGAYAAALRAASKKRKKG
jgi:DNA transformation protein